MIQMIFAFFKIISARYRPTN